MASSSRRRNDGERLCFTSDTPHFFKIVLAHTLREGKLEIPRKFVRKHGKALLNSQICLKVAGGAEWNVGLTKSNGNVWFQKGWQELVEFYSVRLGYFLVFRYEGSSCFHVIIFDHSASEIQYPVKKAHHDEVKRVMFDGQRQLHVPRSSENEESEDDVQILDDIPWKRARDKTQALCFLSNKKMKTDHTCTRKTLCPSRKVVEPSRPEAFNSKAVKMEKITQRNEDFHCAGRESKDFEVGESSRGLKSTIKAEHFWRKQPLTATQQARLIEKATTFRSMTMNPSFVLKMWPSHVYPAKSLNIPRSFAERHFKDSVDRIILQVSDGRIWDVGCCVCRTRNGMKAELRSGWKTFARDNSLQHGDACVFEMVGSLKSEILLKVAVFRG